MVGLLDRTVPHESTAVVLKKLGANDTKASAPVGDCVLGRGGLEVDIQLAKDIQEAKAALEQQQQEN